MRIGIFGGTFDPPHLGHLILAVESLYQLELDRVLFVLTPNPPHKQGQSVSPVEQRLQLLQNLVDEEPAFVASCVDIDRASPHYAVDTVKILRMKLLKYELIYLMGGDSLGELPSWHNPEEFVKACDFLGVMRRPGEHFELLKLEYLIPGITNKIHFVVAPLLEISSTEIRKRIASGQPYQFYLPQKVYQTIKTRHFYGA